MIVKSLSLIPTTLKASALGATLHQPPLTTSIMRKKKNPPKVPTFSSTKKKGKIPLS